MSKMIDVLMGVRTEDIMNDFGKLSKDINSPVSMWSADVFKKYVTYIHEDETMTSVDCSGNLMVKCDVGDVIRMNLITLNNNPDYSVAMMKMDPMMKMDSMMKMDPMMKMDSMMNMDPMMKVMQGDMVQMLEPHKMVASTKYMPVVDVRNPMDVDMQKVRSCYLMTKVNMMPPMGTMRVMYYECILGIYKEGMLQGYIAAEPGLVLDNR
ncbi:AidA/PixA family protein [Xenorhabdus siamensis]|uniref:AidA/PixA family protein n=1 Tax=Xenorhabdus siamensis TaxID=3136254 RepID=UPI0030F3D7B6